MIRVFLALLFFFIFGCQSNPLENSTSKIDESQYSELIDSNSDNAQKYDGPYNIFEVVGTILNSRVSKTQVLRQSEIFHWNKERIELEFKNKLVESKSKSNFFLSFFTPDKKSGNLLRADTLWKIILKTKNREYEGTPKKLSLLPIEIKSLYPYHNQWSSAYTVTFDTPMTEIESETAQLIITGPLGIATLVFKPQ